MDRPSSGRGWVVVCSLKLGLRPYVAYITRLPPLTWLQIMSCMHRRAAVPDSLAISTPLEAASVNDEERAIHELAADIVRFCNCRAQRTLVDVPTRLDSKDPDPAAVVLEMFSIDSSLADWEVRCPPQLRWSTVSVQESHDTVFSDYYHIYQGPYCATLWNHYRSTRLHLLAMLRARLFWLCEYSTDLAESLRQTYTEKMVYCTVTSQRLALDVCASVAYNLGLEPRKSRDKSHAEPSTRAASGNLLIWPLYTSGATRKDPEDPIRVWIVKILKLITEVTGIQQAEVMASYLMQRKEKTCGW